MAWLSSKVRGVRDEMEDAQTDDAEMEKDSDERFVFASSNPVPIV